MARTGPILFFVAFAVCFVGRVNSEYLGKFLGKLSELHHGVSGEVYAVDGRTLFIKDYTYDGQGPAAYFYASTHKSADSRGFRLRDENNNGDVIRRYRKEGVTITLPEGKSLSNIKIFYVWCEEFDVNFGDVKIPRNFDFPRPQKVDALKGVHSISSDNIVIVDAQTLLIPNLHYDGEAPDAKFWVGRGPKPSPQGIRVSDENGKEVPLRKYDGKTVVLTLPGDLTVFDIGHFGIWCEQFTVDFGHIQIPQSLNVPPSLKMLGVSPQSKLNCEVLDDKLAFEVRWAVAGESIVLQLVAKLDSREYMSFGLSGDVSKSVMIGGDVVVAWVDKDTLKGYAQDYYLGDKSQCSGPTGSCPDSRLGDNTNNIRLLNAAMVNGYSIVTYQRPLKASDQYDVPIYTNQSQAILWAVGPLNQRDEVSFHSSYLKRDSFIDFARPAKWNCPLPEGETPARQGVPIQNRHQEDVTSEETVEPAVPSRNPEPEEDEEPAEPSTTVAPRRESGNRRRGSNRVTTRQPVANTDLAEEGQASKREPTRTRGTTRITQRGTPSVQTVPPPTPVKERDAWYIPPIECYEPEDGVFYAQMGPTGGKRGYPAITGHVGWGISWYINGLLIPEINVVRGKTYNFITEGGDNPEVPAKYHPFYITDDPVGGYIYKTEEEKKNVTIYSGVTFDKNDEAQPTGTGRLCHWTQTGESEADDFESFGAYQRTLQLKCDVGEPGVIQWTPDRDTPDTVYYQCFTHRYLGWKINVHDSCEQSAASEFQPSIVPAPKDFQTSFSDQSDVELEASPSIRQETMVMPNHILINQIKAANQINQPTVSETPTTTLDQQHQPSTTRTTFSHHRYTSFDQIQNTPSPLLHRSPVVGTSGLSVRPQQTLGQFIDPDKEATNFRTIPPRDLQLMDYEVFPRKASFVAKRMTTTDRPTELNQPTKPISVTNKKLLYFLPKQNPQLKHFQYTSPLSSNMQYPADFSNGALPINPPKTLYYVALNKQHQLLEHPQPINYNNKPFYRQAPHQKRVPIMYNINPELNPISQTNSAHTFFNTLPMTIAMPIKTLSEASAQASTLKQVEISPEQASTEREPSDIQTASPLTPVHPSSSENLNPITYQTPDNRGFNPESVVVEGGFKPIISQKFEDRVGDDFEPEIEPEGEVGVIEVKGEKKFEGMSIKSNLQPIMIPSPSDDDAVKLPKIKLKKVLIRKPIKKEIVKLIVRTRSLIDSEVEPEMAAADRGQSYYLPPPGQTDKPKLAAAKMPSGIDFEVPDLPSRSGGSSGPSSPSSRVAGPDVVVTFDGRRVSGASLTAKPFEKPVAFERGSKATEFLKALPQSVPYKGDLPPLSANVLFNYKSSAPIGGRGAGVLSRDLDTPLPPSTSSSSTGTTKLQRVRRAAHHTPEHSAQQMDEMRVTQKGNSTTASGSETLMRFSLISLGFSVMAFFLLRR